MTTLFEADTSKTGCAVKPTNLPRGNGVAVNGVVVPRESIARETQNHPADKPIDAWQAAARALVIRELLLQEARRLELAPAPLADDEGRTETDEESLVRLLVEREVKIPEPDDDTCRRIYGQNRQRFRSSDLYAVRHILIPAAPGDDAARRQARETALAVAAAAAAAPASFAELAAAHSACPSSANGGALGQISHGQTVPEFEAALALCQVGAIHPEPIESRYGFHVVIVDQHIAGQDLPFDLVRDQIANWLTARAHHTAIRQYITLLAGRAEITGITLDASTSPLVQ